jgi:hypothetical protein
MFTVIYRIGGTHDCKWNRSFFKHDTIEAAREQANSIEGMGYKAIIRSDAEMQAIALPVGWSSDSVDWESDYIMVTNQTTHHIKRSA